MRSINRIVLATIVFCLPLTSQSAFSSEGEAATRLAGATARTFKLAFDDGFADIELNRRCFSREDSQLTETEVTACTERRAYFQNTIPRAWKKFRLLSALSKWSSKFELRNDNTFPFNFELESHDFASVDRSKIEPLDEFELETAKIEWKIQWDLARSAALSDLAAHVARIKATPGGIGPNEQSALSTAENAKTAIESWPIQKIVHLDNPWIKRVFRRIQFVTFQLNQKRMIRMLAEYPILAHFNAKNISRKELLLAFERQQRLLQSEKQIIAEKYTVLAQKPAGSLKYRDLDFVFDYFLIVEKTLADHPSLKATADTAFEQMIFRDRVQSGIILTAMIALTPFIPVSISVFGILGIQAAALNNAYNVEKSAKSLAFGSSSSELSLKSVDDVYMAETNIGTELLLTAAIGPAVPILRLARFAKILKGQ